jgi:hypothetical protein
MIGRSTPGSFIVLTALLFSGGRACAEPPKYHLINLQSHFPGKCRVLDMNNRNQVVGYRFNADSSRNAFVWRNGTMTLLQSFCNGCDCIAEGINDSGTIVGYAYADSGDADDNVAEFHSVRWDTGGKITDLGVVGGYRSAAFDINNKGQIAGYYSTKDSKGYSEHVYLLEKNTFRELVPGPDFPGCDASLCFSNIGLVRNDKIMIPGRLASAYRLVDEITLNNNGDVASSLASNSDRSYSVLWKYNGDRVDLNANLVKCGYGLLNSLFIPGDMNDSMQIAGYYFQGKSSGNIFNPVAFTYMTQSWMPGSVCPVNLQNNYDDQPNQPGINGKGTVAGTYVDYVPGASHPNKAVMWQNDSVFPLENYVLGVDTMRYHNLTDAFVINDSGTIAGYGNIDGGMWATILLVPQSPQITMPVLGKFTVTLIQASAKLVSDVYLFRPDSTLLIANNLKNVGATVDKTYPSGTQLEFAILVHPLPGKGLPYWFMSDSKHALTTKANDSLWYVRFEDLPDSNADWDFNDVVLRVELNLLEPLPLGNKAPAVVRTAGTAGCGWVDAFDIRGRRIGRYYLDKGRIGAGKSRLTATGMAIVRFSEDSPAKTGPKYLIVR